MDGVDGPGGWMGGWMVLVIRLRLRLRFVGLVYLGR